MTNIGIPFSSAIALDDMVASIDKLTGIQGHHRLSSGGAAHYWMDNSRLESHIEPDVALSALTIAVQSIKALFRIFNKIRLCDY